MRKENVMKEEEEMEYKRRTMINTGGNKRIRD
jgi:hypothetical protein